MTVQLNADLIDGTLASPLEVEAILDDDNEHWVQIRPTEDNQREIIRALARAVTPKIRADLLLVRQLSVLHPEYRRAMDRLLADNELVGALTWLLSPSSADDLTGPLSAASTTLEVCTRAECRRPRLPGEDLCTLHGLLPNAPIPFVPTNFYRHYDPAPATTHRHRGDGASL